MNYITWGEQYLNEADVLNNHIKELREDLKTANSIDSREIKRRILMLYEIQYELCCTGKRLKEESFGGWNSYTH